MIIARFAYAENEIRPDGTVAQIRNSSGLIRVASPTALSSASEYYIYFSGWWLTA